MGRCLLVVAGVVLVWLGTGCGSSRPPLPKDAPSDVAVELGHQAARDMIEAQELVGRARFKEARERFVEARQSLEMIADNQDTIDRLAKAIFWIGFCYERTDEVPLAEVHYNEVLDRFPYSDAARQARNRLANLHPTPNQKPKADS
ncbi:MAG: tetratricopeptide repeat protein [Planctomycetota bacterium]